MAQIVADFRSTRISATPGTAVTLPLIFFTQPMQCSSVRVTLVYAGAGVWASATAARPASTATAIHIVAFIMSRSSLQETGGGNGPAALDTHASIGPEQPQAVGPARQGRPGVGQDRQPQ